MNRGGDSVNLARLIEKWCYLHRRNLAVSFGDQQLTYGGLYERSCRLANALLELGLRPGDRVATLGHNSLTSFEEITGLALGGFTRVALHTMNPQGVHKYMLEHVGARGLIVSESLYKDIENILSELPDLEFIVIQESRGIDQGKDDLDYEKLLASSTPGRPEVTIRPEDPLHLQFTSGTTGMPKATIHTHRSWIGATTENLLMLPELTEEDRYLVAGPLTHAAMTVLFALMARGCACVVMERFQPAEFARLVESKRCTMTVMVPTMIQLLAESADIGEYDLSSLRIILHGGGPITEQTMRNARDVLGEIFYQTYGQTEGIPATILTPRDYAGEIHGRSRVHRSAGRPTPRSIVKIIGDDGRELPSGEAGEIAMYSPGLMEGFWQDPEATADRMTVDGFVKTRDIGYVDDDGYLFLLDRHDDMIISGGFNIWPAEIENALASHPAVLEVAAFGVPHPRWGESPKAVVVLRPGRSASETELIAWCRKQIGPIKKPTSVEFRSDPLPKSAVGKPLRRVLKAEYVIPGEESPR